MRSRPPGLRLAVANLTDAHAVRPFRRCLAAVTEYERSKRHWSTALGDWEGEQVGRSRSQNICIEPASLREVVTATTPGAKDALLAMMHYVCTTPLGVVRSSLEESDCARVDPLRSEATKVATTRNFLHHDSQFYDSAGDAR